MEACLEGEFWDDEIVYNGCSGLGCGVEGFPFDKFFAYPLDNSAPCGFCGFGR